MNLQTAFFSWQSFQQHCSILGEPNQIQYSTGMAYHWIMVGTESDVDEVSAENWKMGDSLLIWVIWEESKGFRRTLGSPQDYATCVKD